LTIGCVYSRCDLAGQLDLNVGKDDRRPAAGQRLGKCPSRYRKRRRSGWRLHLQNFEANSENSSDFLFGPPAVRYYPKISDFFEKYLPA
jgi:hypothetical protein